MYSISKTNNSIETNKGPIGATITNFHLILFVGLNFIFLNGIKRRKINKLKQERYRSNVPKFWTIMLKELLTVPLALFIYWFAFTFIIKVILWFITYIINSRQMYREQMNMNMKQFVVKSITTTIFDNLLIDFKIYAYLFMYNAIILVSILIILLFNLKENINDTFIDRLFFIYQILMTFSIIILFRKFNN